MPRRGRVWRRKGAVVICSEQQLFIGKSLAVQAEVISGTSSPVLADACRSVLISAATTFLSRVGKRLSGQDCFPSEIIPIHQGQIF